MTDDAKTIAEIGKRNEVTMRFKQNLTEAEDDRAALLAIVKRQQDEIADLSSRGLSQYAAVEAAEKHEAALREALLPFKDNPPLRVGDLLSVSQVEAINELVKALAGGPTNG